MFGPHTVVLQLSFLPSVTQVSLQIPCLFASFIAFLKTWVQHPCLFFSKIPLNTNTMACHLGLRFNRIPTVLSFEGKARNVYVKDHPCQAAKHKILNLDSF